MPAHGLGDESLELLTQLLARLPLRRIKVLLEVALELLAFLFGKLVGRRLLRLLGLRFGGLVVAAFDGFLVRGGILGYGNAEPGE